MTLDDEAEKALCVQPLEPNHEGIVVFVRCVLRVPTLDEKEAEGGRGIDRRSGRCWRKTFTNALHPSIPMHCEIPVIHGRIMQTVHGFLERIINALVFGRGVPSGPLQIVIKILERVAVFLEQTHHRFKSMSLLI